VTVWRCPRCGHTEHQHDRVTAVAHLCGIGKRRVHLERIDPELAIEDDARRRYETQLREGRT